MLQVEDANNECSAWKDGGVFFGCGGLVLSLNCMRTVETMTILDASFFRQPHLSNIDLLRMPRAIFHVASEACIHAGAIFRVDVG
jgi:hypothetical protein